MALVAGCIAAALLPFPDRLTRLLAAWNVGVWAYLFSLGWLMFRATSQEVKAIAEREDRSAPVVLVIMVLAAVLSVVAIALELAGTEQLSPLDRVAHYLLTLVTLLGTWLLLGVVFTIHYAHLYYRDDPKNRPLDFPGERPHPDYWDFLYFSFTIGVAAQTADVSVRSHSMRRVVLAQAVLSFLFNLAILGLSVNSAAGLLGH